MSKAKNTPKIFGLIVFAVIGAFVAMDAKVILSRWVTPVPTPTPVQAPIPIGPMPGPVKYKAETVHVDTPMTITPEKDYQLYRVYPLKGVIYVCGAYKDCLRQEACDPEGPACGLNFAGERPKVRLLPGGKGDIARVFFERIEDEK